LKVIGLPSIWPPAAKRYFKLWSRPCAFGVSSERTKSPPGPNIDAAPGVLTVITRPASAPIRSRRMSHFGLPCSSAPAAAVSNAWICSMTFACMSGAA
jgi:hypothetical protein